MLVFCVGCGPALTNRQKVLFSGMVAAQVTSGVTATGDESLGINIGAIAVLWGLGEIWPERREVFYGFGVVTGVVGAANNSRSQATSPSGYDR